MIFRDDDNFTLESIEKKQRTGDIYAFFGDHIFDDNLIGEDAELRFYGLGRIAAELWDVQDATWEGLADRGGYQEYLRQVEAVCQSYCPEIYGATIKDGEEIIEAYAQEKGLDLMYVSGLTGFQEKNGVQEILLSETRDKDWSHQPHGGARMTGEGAVAGMIRELGEEAGWDGAVALLKAFKSGDACYTGYYASRMGDVLGEDNKKANTLLAIQCFVINGKVLEGIELRPDSDSKAAEWLQTDQLPEGFVTTTQADYWLREYFGAMFPTSRYSHPAGSDGTLRDL